MTPDVRNPVPSGQDPYRDIEVAFARDVLGYSVKKLVDKDPTVVRFGLFDHSGQRIGSTFRRIIDPGPDGGESEAWSHLRPRFCTSTRDLFKVMVEMASILPDEVGKGYQREIPELRLRIALGMAAFGPVYLAQASARGLARVNKARSDRIWKEIMAGKHLDLGPFIEEEEKEDEEEA